MMEQSAIDQLKKVADTDPGLMVIPGSRGTFTYIVKSKDRIVDSGYSLPHSAGRKWERSLCKARLADKYTRDTIKFTKFKAGLFVMTRTFFMKKHLRHIKY